MFDIIAQFADYAFNKSHSYGYGYVAYQIAYLKANYPVEYLSALLTSVKTKLESAAVYLNECRLMGIEVEVPDINRSESDFTPVPNLATAESSDGVPANAGDSNGPGSIIFGLSAIRNVGVGFVEKVLAERRANGPFESFVDFVERVELEALNKRTIESLIKGGAFDSLGHPRKGLLQVHEQIIDLTVQRRKEHDMGVMSLFGELDDGPTFDERPSVPDVEFEKMPKLSHEKEMLGLYISDHPLLGFEGHVRRKSDCSIGDLADGEDGAIKKVGGVITNLQRKWTRKGDLMAVFELEDLEGSVEIMVFPRTMQEHGPKLEDDKIVLVRGRLENDGDLPKLFAQDIEVIEDLGDNQPVRVKLDPAGGSEDKLAELKNILSAHPGDSPVELHLSDRRVIRLPDDFAVDNANGVVAELRVLLGPDSILV
jgi:DNA polymerase-3 subunit alpha